MFRTTATAREAERFQQLCYDAASRIYQTTSQPSLAYQTRVARLLFATIAHESGGFRHRRQMSRKGGYMSATSDVGAFGMAQCERGSIMGSVAYCQARPALNDRVKGFICEWDGWGDWPKMRRWLQTDCGDRLSVALCRLHYLRVPSHVPGDLEAQAEYAKRFYNTRYGKATPAHYRDAFLALWPEG